MTHCRSCGAPIWWAYSTGGKRIPIDADPVEDANLVAVDRTGQPLDPDRARDAVTRGQATVTVARRALRSMNPELPRWRTHFSTCPHADRHRTRPVTPERLTKTQDTLPL